jgi:hypothetical protein
MSLVASINIDTLAKAKNAAKHANIERHHLIKGQAQNTASQAEALP